MALLQPPPHTDLPGTARPHRHLDPSGLKVARRTRSAVTIATSTSDVDKEVVRMRRTVITLALLLAANAIGLIIAAAVLDKMEL